MCSSDMQMVVAQCLGLNIEADWQQPVDPPSLASLLQEKSRFGINNIPAKRHNPCRQVGQLPLKTDHQTPFKRQIYDDLCGYIFLGSQWFKFR